MNERSGRSGVILIPFVISMFTVTTLVGLLTEATLVLHAKHKLHDGAETALLAAANNYSTGANTYTTTQLNDLVKTTYATQNFLNASTTELNFTQIGNGTLILSTSKSIPTLFVKNFIPNLTLTVNVAATVPQPADDISGIAPLAMLTSDFSLGSSYTIKQGSGSTYSPGNFGPLALSGNGATDYENDFKYGYSGTIGIGDNLNYKTGNMSGSTQDGAIYRLASSDPVILIVLTNAFPTGSSSTINVVGFAAFKITGYGTGSASGEVTGTFVKYKVGNATGDSSKTAYGVYTKPKLIYL